MRIRMIHSLLLLFCLSALPAVAQQRLKFEVADFHKDAFAMTARSDEFKKADDSGSLYAIIKVTSDIEGDDLQKFRFDFGNMNSFTSHHDDTGELWVYVQRNARRVTISREGYTTVKYDLQTTIEAGSTYEMRLIVHTPIVQQRILQFKVTPADEGAIVKVKPENSDGDYELWGTVDASGSIDRRLEVGTYLYEVAAPNYEVSQGRIVLANGNGNHVETVELKPNFGWLEIQDTYGIAGAEIYVDNKKLGTVPYKSNDRWEARDGYKLMISAGELYKTYNATFNIRKGEVTKLQPRLESDFAKTTLKVQDDDKADIYINGTRRGTGTWSGPLKAGAYNIECRHANHRSTTSQIVVKPNQEEAFVLTAPTPITGTIYVSTQPAGAKVYLDGVEKGVSPIDLKDVLIGGHHVRVTMDNYKAEQQQVEVKENSTTETRIELRDYAKFTISSQPRARLSIDGRDVGMTPYSFEGTSGEYNLRLTLRKYKTYHKKTFLRSSAPDQTFNLKKQYQRPTSGYLQASFQVGMLTGPSAHIGTYIHNVNLEAFGMMGLSKETLYFNYTDGSASESLNLNALTIGGKLGYGITIGTRLRLTPQAGMGLLKVDSDDALRHSGEYGSITASALFATLGCRFDYAIANFIGLNLTPEGQFVVSDKEVFPMLSDISPKIKGWGTGVNVRLGMYFYF